MCGHHTWKSWRAVNIRCLRMLLWMRNTASTCKFNVGDANWFRTFQARMIHLKLCQNAHQPKAAEWQHTKGGGTKNQQTWHNFWHKKITKHTTNYRSGNTPDTWAPWTPSSSAPSPHRMPSYPARLFAPFGQKNPAPPPPRSAVVRKPKTLIQSFVSLHQTLNSHGSLIKRPNFAHFRPCRPL